MIQLLLLYNNLLLLFYCVRSHAFVHFRFLLTSSEYHQKCIPAEVRKMAEASQASPTKPLSDSEVAKLNVVAQDAVWTERVVQEKQGAQSWEENWGFMAQFDPKVNVQQDLARFNKIAV